jgi:hypothetical protein
MEENKFVVSNEFLDIYRKFNVIEQVERIEKLKVNNPMEFYLLLIKVIDSHDEDDNQFLLNIRPFQTEVMEIYDMQDDKEVTNEILKQLSKVTGDNYINTDCLVDSDGNQLPEPYNKAEVRDLKINIITGS